jgi:hypothetical protein
VNAMPDERERQERIPLGKELEIETEEADSLYQKEIQSLQQDSEVQKLGSRVTLLFIIIPSLLCAVFVFAYMDLRSRLSEVQSSGVQEVRALTQDVVARVDAVAEEQKRAGQSLGGKLATLEQAMGEAQEGMKDSRKKIDALGTSKADRETLETLDKALNEAMAARFDALKNEVSAQRASVDAVAQKLEKELKEEANAVAAFQSDLGVQGEQLTGIAQTLEGVQKKALDMDLALRRLSEDKLDKETWRESLIKEKQAIEALGKKTSALSEEIAWLETHLKVKKERRDAPETSEAGSGGSPAGQSPAVPGPEPGRIVEQEIPR